MSEVAILQIWLQERTKRIVEEFERKRDATGMSMLDPDMKKWARSQERKEVRDFIRIQEEFDNVAQVSKMTPNKRDRLIRKLKKM